MKIDFFNLNEQYESVKNEITTSLTDIFNRQHFILGKYVNEFEEKFAAYCGTKFCVGVSSGTDAILASLMALNIQPGDEVILPDFTFFATAGAVVRMNAKPVFVDVELETYSISTTAVEQAITSKTKAIIPVHIFGQCADMAPLQQISEKYNIPIIEDAAQGVGAEYKDGRKAGNLGLMGCFSFYPTKNLGGAGDGGAITTNDEHLYNKIKQMRNHGMEPKYYHSFVGGNFRLDEIQAAVLLAKLPYLDKWNQLRRLNATFYRKYFINYNLIITGERKLTPENLVVTPYRAYKSSNINTDHTVHQYSVLVNKRDELKQFLTDNDVGSDIYYPIPLHKQDCFKQYDYDDNDYLNTNYICEHIISLPIYPEISEQAIMQVVECISKFYNK